MQFKYAVPPSHQNILVKMSNVPLHVMYLVQYYIIYCLGIPRILENVVTRRRTIKE